MASQELAILHIEDDPNDAELIKRQLRRKGLSCNIRQVLSKGDFLTALESETFDLILSDYTIPGFDGASALDIARKRCPDTPFIFLSGTIGEERAVSILKQGASDYVLKDNLTRLPSVIERTLREAELKREREKAEAALQQSRHFIERVTEAVPDILYVFDLTDERSVYVSGKVQSLLGFTPNDLLQHTSLLADLVHPDDFSNVENFFASFGECSDEDIREIDTRLRHADQGWRWFRVRGTVFSRDDQGEAAQILGTVHDITHRREAREQLRQQATLLEIARDAILVLDLDLNIRFWNHAAEALYESPREEIIGKPHDILFGSGESSQVTESIREQLLKHGEWFGELQHQTQSGRKVAVQSRWSLAEDEKSGKTSILVINTDITEKKDLERQFLRAQRLESVGALAGGVAHDLNNILSPILMGAEVLHSRATNEEDQKIVEAMLNSARRGADLVRQVLTFARGTQNQVESVQIYEAFSEVDAIARNTFPRTIRVTKNCPTDLWPVRGDMTKIHQILLNLCVNSRDAMPNGGRLHLEAKNVVLDDENAASIPEADAGSYVVLSVSDTGVGIDEETRKRIFDPFFTTKAAGHGTGLGLATVDSLVKAHHGFLTLESSVGNGTTFTVYLPADRSVGKVSPDADVHRSRQGGTELILLIDDETTIIDITSETLRSFGYRVITASDGAEGLAAYAQRSHEIAAVITDSNMPILDGPGTVRAMQRINPDLKVIIIAGFLDDKTSGDFNDLAVSDILRKPFTTNQLLTSLRTALDT